MELSKKGDFCLENKRDEEQMSYHNSSLPSEWQFNHQQMNSSIMDSFSSDWSSAILPSRFAHLSSDSGFIERAAMFSCFTGGNNNITANEPLSQMTDHRDEKGSKNEPEEEATIYSSGGTGSMKRKRSKMDVELSQAQGAIKTMKENLESNVKCSNKKAKDCLEAPKENYIHLRARRGQATNSHSLAERVRRERISERMKLLQHLVPGCSKVTAKAVMLDEIIDYVQSLQRQVEFLSMKLAAVNPSTDLNIEGLLSKDILQLCGASSSSMCFSLDMIQSQLHPGVVNSSDAFRRMIDAQLSSANEYKEHAPQMQRPWEDELHNALQMNFGFNPSLNVQESNDRYREGYPI